MSVDRDPPRLSTLSSSDDALLRRALQQARADVPRADVLARVAARLPIGPGPSGGGPRPSGAPPNNPAIGAGAGAAALSSLAPIASSIAIGTAAGVVASFFLWSIDPGAAKPPEPPGAPAPAFVVSAEPTGASPPSEPESNVLVSPVAKVEAKGAEERAPAAPSAPPAVPQQKITLGPADAPSTALSARETAVSGAAPPSDDESEASLLISAQAQLGSNPSGALALADRHRSLFPKGNMGQERELIAVSALAALGRMAEARSRAEALLVAHPQSAHRRRLSGMIPGLAGSSEKIP